MAENSKDPEDPSPNPFELDDPRHGVWNKATRVALIEVHELRQAYLEESSIADKPFRQLLEENRDQLREFNALTLEAEYHGLAEYLFRRFQIWAKRALSIVHDDEDARDYKRWLKSYMDSELKLWTEDCPDPFDAERFIGILTRHLQRAYDYWSANALNQVAEVEAIDAIASAQGALDRAQVATAALSPELLAALDAARISGRDLSTIGEESVRAFGDVQILDGSVFRGIDADVLSAAAANAQMAVSDFSLINTVRPLKTLDDRMDAPAPAAASVSAPSRPGIEAPQPAAEHGSDYTFRKEGRVWEIAFASPRKFVLNLVGMVYIAALLRTPRTEIEALTLATNASDAEGRQLLSAGLEVADEEAIRQVQEALDEKRETLSRIDASDWARRGQLQEDIEQFEEYLSKATRASGGVRKEGGSIERARVSVTNAIKRAIENIREVLPDLATHLEKSIRTGTALVYAPDEIPDWEF